MILAWRSGEASSWSSALRPGCVEERWRRCPAAGLATYSDRSLLTSGRLISGFLSTITRELLPFGWMTGLISTGTGLEELGNLSKKMSAILVMWRRESF